MNLDMAISRELKRSPMENAMHGVSENLGGQYQMKALPQTMATVDDLFGTNLGNYSTGGVSRPSYKAKEDTHTPSDFADVISGYTLAYHADTNKWCLYNGVIENQNPDMLTKVVRFLRGEKTVPAMPPVEITKYGEGSAHRFLSALESEPDISSDVKKVIANRVVRVMSGDAAAMNLSDGHTVADTSQMSTIDIAGSTPVGGSSFNNGAMELNMAETYSGVSKQRNSTFMGDTVIPAPVSKAQVYQTSSAVGFNQNNAGLINRPPTKVPLQGQFTKTSRSF